MCNVWWTKWHFDRILYEYFGLTPSVPFHHCSILILHSSTTVELGRLGTLLTLNHMVDLENHMVDHIW